MKRIFVGVLIFIAVGYTFITFDLGSAQEGKSDKGVAIKFSKKLHRALTAEMNALQNGITNLTIDIPADRLTR